MSIVNKVRKYAHLLRILPIIHSDVEANRQAVSDLRKQNHDLEKFIQTRLFGNNPANDSFYIGFEHRFRGGESSIIDRQRYYVPYLEHLKGGRRRVVDIGCGRGEFLSLMSEEKIPAVGVDLNRAMVQRVRAKKLKAEVQDANEFLHNQRPGSVGAITGFHIVEHIPFSELLVLFRSCYASLNEGGLVIFETPNPESIPVGTHNFWMDPSHLNPVPPALLKYALESVGFKDATVHRLHPTLENPNTEGLHEDVKKIVERFYGPRDYAIIAKKITRPVTTPKEQKSSK